MDATTATKPASCVDTSGNLPSCAPLATPYVPFQQVNPQVYPATQAFIRGTLYPGLDLPFQNQVNTTEKTATLRNKMQALSFAVDELGLYLDTHSTDQDAVDLFNQYVERYEDVVQQYESQFGALTQMSSAMEGTYDWLKDPWPWDYRNKEER